MASEDGAAAIIATVATRWDEIMAGAADGISRHDEADPRQWSLKAYRPLA